MDSSQTIQTEKFHIKSSFLTLLELCRQSGRTDPQSQHSEAELGGAVTWEEAPALHSPLVPTGHGGRGAVNRLGHGPSGFKPGPSWGKRGQLITLVPSQTICSLLVPLAPAS